MASFFSHPAPSGFHVLVVVDGSPAADAGLVPALDYVTAVNGSALDASPAGSLSAKLLPCAGVETELSVFSLKTLAVRKLLLTPRPWAGPGTLGAVVRFEAASPRDKGARFAVTGVAAGGPAARAGLVAGDDFILGTETAALRTADDVRAVLRAGHAAAPPPQAPLPAAAPPPSKSSPAAAMRASPAAAAAHVGHAIGGFFSKVSQLAHRPVAPPPAPAQIEPGPNPFGE
jgi:S1-C subfamily serine protease